MSAWLFGLAITLLVGAAATAYLWLIRRRDDETAAGLLASMLGFTEPEVGLMIATYIAIDSFGTATNVTGDGAIAAIMDKLIGRSKGYDELEEEAEAAAVA